MKTTDLDPYYYARDHAGGPGAWCVRGPNGFQIEVADKCVAYIIGKLLSDKLVDAKQLLDDLVQDDKGSLKTTDFRELKSDFYSGKSTDRDPNCPFAPYGCDEHGPDGCVYYLEPEEFERVTDIINNPAPPTEVLRQLLIKTEPLIRRAQE